MTSKAKSLLACLLLLLIFASALWLLEKNESSALARRLSEARSELSDAEARKKGMEEANEDLRAQLRTLRNSPPIFTVSESVEDLSSTDAFDEEEPPRGRWNQNRSVSGSDTDEEQSGEEVLTPEQIAERKEREARRQAWREEREKRREDFRARMTEDLQVRKAFFAQMSTDGLAPEYKQAHDQLLASLDHMQTLMNQMGDPELERDQRREVMREMAQTSRDVRGLMDMQRDVLLNDYAQSIGLGAKETRDFVDYLQAVNEMTSPSPMGGGRGR